VKFLITVLIIVFSQVTFAKSELPKDCNHLKEVSEANSVLFNKKEFIQLGECLAIHTIKRKPIVDLGMICKEVIEYQNGPFGTLSLTKLEAIYIGQCSGVISYTYQRYNEEYPSNMNLRHRRNNKYSCVNGMDAVHVLSEITAEKTSRSELRDLLCEVR